MKFKRTASLFLTIAFISSSVLSVSAKKPHFDTEAVYAQEAPVKVSSDTDFKYEVEGGYIYFDEATGTITDCDFDVKKVVIPEMINGVAVTCIGRESFLYKDIEEITIPQSVTRIEERAFGECDELTRIDIHAGITEIGDGAFSKCENLKEINVDAANPNYTVVDNVLYTKDMSELLCYPAKKEGTEFTVPDTVKVIGECAFSCADLEKVDVPDGLTTVKKQGFAHTEIEGMELPSSVTSIGEGAFEFCDKLTSIVIPDKITRIEDSTFCYCGGLESVTLPKGIKSIGAWAFKMCRLSAGIDLPESLESIGDISFDNTKMNSIFIPKNVSYIGNNPFSDCKQLTEINVDPENAVYTSVNGVLYSKDMSKLLIYPGGSMTEEFEVPESVTDIEKRGFYGCDKIKKVVLPENLSVIREYSFAWCTNLENIIFPDGLKKIEERAFVDCDSLENILLPEIEYLSVSAFGSCKNLHEARFKGDAPEITVEDSYAHADDLFKFTANDFKILYIEGKNGWTTPAWNDCPCFPIPDIDGEMSVYMPVAEINSDENGDLVYTSGIDSLNYKEVGFIFECNGVKVRRSTNTVYTSIEDSDYGLSDFDGAAYLYSFKIDDIPYLNAIMVKPFAVDLDGNEIVGSMNVYMPKYEYEEDEDEIDIEADAAESGSAIETYAAEPEEMPVHSKEDTADEENVDIDKEEAVLPDTEITDTEERE